MGKSFRFHHTYDGIQTLILRLQEAESLTENKPVIVLESTGHYYLGLVAHFKKQRDEVIILSSLIARRARKSKLRSVDP
ncbi:transposase [Paenibacillus ihuae]|uniref:transposase n=1 Tax=Paenibacillus ihuae TaxID=1232431 RepID=UPI000AC99787|nr:transposase [Paenibacillus ihuae]